MDPMKPKKLGTLKVTLEDGRVLKFKLMANVRWSEPVLEVWDAETNGKVNWVAFKELGSLPASVGLSKVKVKK